MNGGYIAIIMLLCIIVIIFRRRRAVSAVILQRIINKGGTNKMNGIVKEFIGKECIISTIDGSLSSVTGIPERLEDGWLIVKSFDGKITEAVNLSYIIRIQEYPKNKKGKRAVIAGL